MDIEYLVLLIPALFAGLIVFTLIRQRKIESRREELLTEIDKDLKEGNIKMQTLLAFVKQGYHLPLGEKVVEVGDGYIVSEDSTGQQTVIPQDEARKH